MYSAVASSAIRMLSTLKGLGKIAITPACFTASSFSKGCSLEISINGTSFRSSEARIRSNNSDPVPLPKYMLLITRSGVNAHILRHAASGSAASSTLSLPTARNLEAMILRWVNEGSSNKIDNCSIESRGIDRYF